MKPHFHLVLYWNSSQYYKAKEREKKKEGGGRGQEKDKRGKREEKDLLFVAITILHIRLQEYTAMHVSMMWLKDVWLVCSAGC